MRKKILISAVFLLALTGCGTPQKERMEEMRIESEELKAQHDAEIERKFQEAMEMYEANK